MSYDGLDDRNRTLSSEGFDSWNREHAGVTDSDSAEVARGKLLAQNSRPSAGGAYETSFDTASGGGGGGGGGDTDGTILVLKVIGCAIGLYLLTCILSAAWSAKDELFAYWRKTRHAEIADKRIEEYSDFSKLSDWPREVQAIYQKQESKPLGKMLDEIPSNLNSLSSEKRDMLGAQIWFKISSKGAGASEFLSTVQATPHRVSSPILRAASLSLHFLKTECQKGLEFACLDAAKSFAGLVWHGKNSAEAHWIINAALDQLPSSGPLAKSDAIESLRAKLLATGKSLQK
jgi:hypothetical protein